jgi:hypothetical protein
VSFIFDASGNQIAVNTTSAAVLSWGFLWGVWVNPTPDADGVLLFNGDQQSASQYYELTVDADEGVRHTVADGSLEHAIRDGWTPDEWQLVAGTEVGVTERYAWAEGGFGLPNNALANPSGEDAFAIGCRFDATPDGPYDGKAAHAFVYVENFANASEVQILIDALAEGRNPLDVAPWLLEHYYPLQSDLEDAVGGLDLVGGNLGEYGGSGAGAPVLDADDNPPVQEQRDTGTGVADVETFTNVQPFRNFLYRGQELYRAAFLSLGDSNQHRQDSGHSEGLIHGLIENGFDLYGSPLFPAGGGVDPGSQFRQWNNLQTVWTFDDFSAPEAQREWLIDDDGEEGSPHVYAHLAEGTVIGWWATAAGCRLNASPNNIDQDSDLRLHVYDVTFDSGAGYFTPSIYGDNSKIAGIDPVATNTGSVELRETTVDLPAGDREYDRIYFRYFDRSASAAEGPLCLVYMGVTVPSRTTGFAGYTFWAKDGDDPNETLNSLTAIDESDDSIELWLHAVLSHLNGPRKPACVVLNYGQNGIQFSKQNYKSYFENLIEFMKNKWASAGGNLDDLYFLIVVAHARRNPYADYDGGNGNLELFREAASEIATDDPSGRVSAVNIDRLLSANHLWHNAWYQNGAESDPDHDFVHLLPPAYLRYWDLIIESALQVDPTYEPCTGDLNGDDLVNVLDLLALLAAWGASDVPEDLNGDGTVNVLDLLDLLAAWGECA